MINYKEAIKIFTKQHKNLEITSCKDYGDSYLITALSNTNDSDIDPFYLVNKTTESVTNYTISQNIKKYYTANELLKG